MPYIQQAAKGHVGAKNSQASCHNTDSHHDKGEQEHWGEEQKKEGNVKHEEEEDYNEDQGCHC